MSVAGLIGCLLFFGVLWHVGGLGAGDVKLFMAIGALKGLIFVVHVCFYTICAGAVVGLFLLTWQCRLWSVSKWVALNLVSIIIPSMPVPCLQGEKTVMPFAPCIFLGTLITAYLNPF
jgi:Flp pilus assembly protein protease CpaA